MIAFHFCQVMKSMNLKGNTTKAKNKTARSFTSQAFDNDLKLIVLRGHKYCIKQRFFSFFSTINRFLHCEKSVWKLPSIQCTICCYYILHVVFGHFFQQYSYIGPLRMMRHLLGHQKCRSLAMSQLACSNSSKHYGFRGSCYFLFYFDLTLKEIWFSYTIFYYGC